MNWLNHSIQRTEASPFAQLQYGHQSRPASAADADCWTASLMWPTTIACLITAVFCILSSHAAPPPSPSAEELTIETIVKRLRACPDPIDIEETNVARRAEILRTLLPICAYDIGAIRAAEKLFIMSDKYSEFDEAKLYVFHRCLFDVPERPTGADRRVFSGWRACHDSKGYNMLWPLSKTASGILILKSMNSAYMGPSYDAQGEFDFFRGRFPLREKRTK